MTMHLVAPHNHLDRFLVIGTGSQQRGDEAAGPQVARAVENWQLASVNAIAVPRLVPSLAQAILNTDYVIFVEACSGSRPTQSVKIEPIVGNIQSRRVLSNSSHYLNPWTLLNLVKQCYDVSPQAWLLQIPTERFEPNAPLSKTALHGCDRAVNTISQFVKTYSQPTYLPQKHYAEPATQKQLSYA